MKVVNIGLSTSSFGYSMGNAGKNTDRKNTNPWTIEDFVDFTNQNGFGGIEAPLMRFIPNLERDRLKKLRAKLLERDMFFIIDSEEALNIEQIKTLMPIAKEFGSPIIRIKSSNILGCERKKLGKSWKEHVESCISTLRVIAPDLRRDHLKIAIENHQDLDSNDLLQIIESVGEDVVGVNFDIGNALSTCEDPLEFAKKLGPFILNIHLKDYKIFKSEDGFRLARCPLGEGSVDFKNVLSILVKSSPNVRMVVELGALEARNVGWMKPDFWQEIQSRTHLELIPFFQLLEEKVIRDKDHSWKTPWEMGAEGSNVTFYEINELKTSVNYLSKL